MAKGKKTKGTKGKGTKAKGRRAALAQALRDHGFRRSTVTGMLERLPGLGKRSKKGKKGKG